MKILLSPLGIVVLAGVLLWSFAVLPGQVKQGKLGAGIGTSIEEGVGTVSPSITVTVSPSSQRAGESVVVTVATLENDVAIFLPIDIYLESSTGLTSAKGSIVDIDGQGNRFGSIALPADAEPGIWKVKTVEIINTQGAVASYSYGTDIFSTFQVE